MFLCPFSEGTAFSLEESCSHGTFLCSLSRATPASWPRAQLPTQRPAMPCSPGLETPPCPLQSRHVAPLPAFSLATTFCGPFLTLPSPGHALPRGMSQLPVCGLSSRAAQPGAVLQPYGLSMALHTVGVCT